jgi:hypothetical protein
MKKPKLIFDLQYEFDLVGIVAPIKDYKMAWSINHSLDVNLCKSDDFELNFINLPPLKISRYFEEMENGFIQLLKNRALDDKWTLPYLIPELKFIDYFLLIQDQTGQLNINAYIDKLSQSPYIQSAIKLDIAKIKSKENLLTY